MLETIFFQVRVQWMTLFLLPGEHVATIGAAGSLGSMATYSDPVLALSHLNCTGLTELEMAIRHRDLQFVQKFFGSSRRGKGVLRLLIHTVLNSRANLAPFSAQFCRQNLSSGIRV